MAAGDWDDRRLSGYVSIRTPLERVYTLLRVSRVSTYLLNLLQYVPYNQLAIRLQLKC